MRSNDSVVSFRQRRLALLAGVGFALLPPTAALAQSAAPSPGFAVIQPRENAAGFRAVEKAGERKAAPAQVVAAPASMPTLATRPTTIAIAPTRPASPPASSAAPSIVSSPAPNAAPVAIATVAPAVVAAAVPEAPKLKAAEQDAPTSPVVTASLPAKPEPITTPSEPLSDKQPPEATEDAASVRNVDGRDNVKMVNQAHPIMAESTRRAMEGFDAFYETALKPPPGATGFAIKIKMKSEGETENIWVAGVQRKIRKKMFITVSDSFSAILVNEPMGLKNHKMGDRVSFSRGDIVDWSYRTADGRLHGNFTGCAILAMQGAKPVAEAERTMGLSCGWAKQFLLAAR